MIDSDTTILGCPQFECREKQTNADRIRSMTDEELADFFIEWVDCEYCPVGIDKCRTEWRPNCKGAFLAWLKEEEDRPAWL